MPKDLVTTLRENGADVRALADGTPDWTVASAAFDALFQKMADPKGAWSQSFIDDLHASYFRARDEDTECANVTIRTVNAVAAGKRNETKKVLLEIASVCRVFNAAHKVNFAPEELPTDFDAVPMKPTKKKDVFTYQDEMPSLYPKTSLTFDYWVPKVLDWTQEIRSQGIRAWRNGAATNLDSCTDFMTVCVAFLAAPDSNVPIAKSEDRRAFLDLLGEPFIWKKKSAKREDVAANSAALKSGLARAAEGAGADIAIETWSRLQHAPFIKSLLKQG
jgi:hypothetical protein